MYTKDAVLYNSLCQMAKKKGNSLDELLHAWGFKYVRQKRGPKPSFDPATIAKLTEDFHVKQIDIARWLGLSRQSINNQLSGCVKDQVSWVNEQITDYEESVIRQMVEEKKYEYHMDRLRITIVTNFKQPCLLINHDDKKKVIFNIPSQLLAFLKANQYDIFSKEDQQVKNEFQIVTDADGQYVKISDQKIKARVKKQCNLRNITIDEYCRLHGYKGYYRERRKKIKTECE